MTVERDEQSGGRRLMAVGMVVLTLVLSAGIGFCGADFASAGGDIALRGLAAKKAAAPSAELMAAISEVMSVKGMGAAAETDASIQLDGDTVRFYFALGETGLGKGATDALARIVRGVAAGRTAVISGYPDSRGDPAFSEVLAGQRALAVQDALKALGIGEDKLELRRPEVAVDGADDEWARRVDVTLQD